MSNITGLNRLPKEGFIWVKSTEFKRGVDNVPMFDYPTVTSDAYEGHYKRISDSREHALSNLQVDGLADVAAAEGWLLMKIKLVEVYFSKKDIYRDWTKKAKADKPKASALQTGRKREGNNIPQNHGSAAVA